MATIGKGKGKLAGNNHLGGDAVYYPASNGGTSGAKDSSGTVGNNEIWTNETDHGVWSDGEGVVEMKDQVGGDLAEGERNVETFRITVECTICKDDITDHERNPCVRAPCCKAIAHKGCVEEWLRRESRCFVCPNVITTRHGRASYFAHTLTTEDLAVESEQKVQRKLADPGDLKEEFQKAREKFFAGNRVSDEKAFNELLAMENLDGRVVPFADFVAQQEKVLAQVLAKNSMQATEAKDENLARQLEEEWKSLASVAADEALARKLEEEEKAAEAAAALRAKKEVEENERVARELAERLEKEARAEDEKETIESEVEFAEDGPKQETGARDKESELRGRLGSPASEGSAAKVGRGRDGSAMQSDHNGRGVMVATAGERGLGGGKASSERICGGDNGTEDEAEEGNLEDDDDDEDWVEEKKRKNTFLGGISKRRMSMAGENIGGIRRRARSNSSSSKSGRHGSSSRQHTADAGAGVVSGMRKGEGKAPPACSPRRAIGQSKSSRAVAKEGLGQIAMSDEEGEDSDDTGRLNLSVPLSKTTGNVSPSVRARRAEAARMAAAEAEADSTRETALAAAAIAEASASKGNREGSAVGSGEAAARGSGVSGASAVRYATSYSRLPAASKRSSSGKRNPNTRLGATAEDDVRKETNTIDLSRTD